MRKLATETDYGTPEPLIAIVQAPRWPWAGTPRAFRCYVRNSDGKPIPLPYTMMHELPDPAAEVPTWPWPRARFN